MLTPASTARSFSEFPLGHTPATADETAYTQPGQRPEPLDQISYFDTIMRLRCRRPLKRWRRFSCN